MMINKDDMELSKALNVLASTNEKIPKNSPTAPSNLHNLKGRALENLVKYLFKISGGLFETSCNLRTSTNEIDDLITLTPFGKILLNHDLINKRLCILLGECKNYDKSVSVTYIGKFCSLLLTNNVKLGILFSYHGVSGPGWNSGSGLIKKFYLHKEDLEDRFCIVDFSMKDFNAILSTLVLWWHSCFFYVQKLLIKFSEVRGIIKNIN